ncbi:YlzJ-like family protein [Rossellomorea aquimaris]|uniref:YlzJ-like family protein n=1 Tax=Rossellomorea aquimaris TaxID=189382 RepID=UPI001CD438FE|nr:YlzJ-like family protein [Rossellomorea aquimaris]MCA1053570.1 YlzJ-like family protein [Rossellomorea aquimaris]
MILYTTVPQEQIYPTDASEFTGQMMMEHQGIPMLVQKADDRYRIVRIMSSDPAHYLDGTICPGEYITF